MAIICPDLRLLFVMVPGTGCSVVGEVLRKQFGGTYLPEHDLVLKGRFHGRKHNSITQLKRDGILDVDALANLLVVATIRNPFDRLVTYWQRLASEWGEYSFSIQQRELEARSAELKSHEQAALMGELETRRRRHDRRKRWTRRVGFNNWLAIAIARQLMRSRGAASDARAPAERTNQDYLFPMLDGVDVVIRYEYLEAGLNEVLFARGAGVSACLPRKNETPGKNDYRSYYRHWSRRFMERAFNRDLHEFGYTFDGPVDRTATMPLPGTADKHPPLPAQQRG